jgi:hypothetical protein
MGIGLLDASLIDIDTYMDLITIHTKALDIHHQTEYATQAQIDLFFS